MKKKFSGFIEQLAKLNIVLGEYQLNQFNTYYEMLCEKNKVMNLTSITDFNQVVEKHFFDSVSCVKAVDLSNPKTMIDVGTGAGFPGIPLKIVFPKINVTLLDSLNKRIEFLKEVILTLELQNIQAYHGRAEDFSRKEEHREKYDVCVSRAVANYSTLLEYCMPFVKVNGIFIAYKSSNIEEELIKSQKAIDELGGSLEKIIPFSLPESGAGRTLVILKKIMKNSSKYPRKAGMATKCPIE